MITLMICVTGAFRCVTIRVGRFALGRSPPSPGGRRLKRRVGFVTNMNQKRKETQMKCRKVRLTLLLLTVTAIMTGGLTRSAYAASVAYSASVPGRGWQPITTDGQMIGTTGESLPI